MNGTSANSDGLGEAYATVRLELESRPECITLVRSMLAGLGEYLAFDPELLDDLKTAVSEACNNVVLHAYDGNPGPLLFQLDLTQDGLEVRVRDRGAGIQRVSARENRMGVGLAVISALANRAEFESTPGDGTEVRMSFARSGGAGLATIPERPASVSAAPVLAGDIIATVSPVELVPQVLGRLLRAVAAGSYFTVDRLPGLYRLAAALGERAAETGDASVSFSIVGRPRWVELSIGPLRPGSGTRLFGSDSAPAELKPILADVSSSPLSGGELLTVTLVQPRA